MTFRRLESYGLLAGLRPSEMKHMKPGEVLDLFVWRRTYDDQLHGIKRG